MFISLDLFQSFVQKTRLVFVLLQMYSMVQFIVITGCWRWQWHGRWKDICGCHILIRLICRRQLPANARLLQIKRIEFRVDITQQVGFHQHLSHDSKQSDKAQRCANWKTLKRKQKRYYRINLGRQGILDNRLDLLINKLANKMQLHKVLKLLGQLSGPDISEEFADQQLVGFLLSGQL